MKCPERNPLQPAAAKRFSVWAPGYFIAKRGARRFLGGHNFNPMQWYYAVGDQRQGPIDQAEFDRLVSVGTIKSDTLVWRQGMAAWQPYSTVAGAAGAVATTVDDGTEVCVVSGKRYPRREMIQYEGKWISAEHRDEYFQRMREGVATPGASTVPGPYGYGGFWRRFVARIVDGIIQAVIGMVIGAIVGFIFGASGALRSGNSGAFLLMQAIIQILALAMGIFYEVFFIRKYDATPGKMAMGMKILRADGAKLSVGRVIGRYFATIISALPLAIGYIVAAFDDEKRTFHDRICDTRVIKTR
jgi:uncharacterized RDD family membrane protein YckC